MLLDELARIRGRIGTAFSPGRKQTGLTEVEWIVLNAVTGATNPPTVPQIGRSLGHARQVVQRAATRLVDHGLVEWIDNPDHKRAQRLVATADGRQMKMQADARGLEMAASLVQGLDPAVVTGAIDAIRTIRQHLEAQIRRA
jgi:DNA-binding MarR family transcriptional regulator